MFISRFLLEERCLVRYRGALVEARNEGRISPSTATTRMRQVVHFYRWVQARGLFRHASPLWLDRIVYIRHFDSVGFERTLARLTTDLAIPNRARPGERLECGLLPVSASDRDAILAFAREHASPELLRILSLGFFAGLFHRTAPIAPRTLIVAAQFSDFVRDFPLWTQRHLCPAKAWGAMRPEFRRSRSDAY